jgi:glycine/serine hydroxymethyltransferase
VEHELAAVDTDVEGALAREEQRQRGQLELIAPKNYMFALLEPGDTLLSMPLRDGGLSHGDPGNFSGRWFRIVRYGVRERDGLIDCDAMEEACRRERPRLIITGGSSYPRAIDFARCCEIARSVGACLLRMPRTSRDSWLPASIRTRSRTSTS